jgi:hypothetical protein
MAIFDEHKNFAYSLIKTPPSPALSGASLVVDDPQNFGSTPFRAWAVPNGQRPSAANAEIIDVLSGSGTVADPYVIERTIEDSVAQPIAGGWLLVAGITAGTIELIEFLLLNHRHDGGDGTLPLTTGSVVINQTPSGLVNGANKIFTTATDYATGSLKVYLNGQRLFPGVGNDYVETGANGFTLTTAPLVGAKLRVDYHTADTLFMTGSASFREAYVLPNPGDANLVQFTTPTPYVPGSLQVYKNGLRMRRTDDYNETNPATGAFTFIASTLSGSTILVDYQESLSFAGNADLVDGFHATQTPQPNSITVTDNQGSLNAGIVGEIKQGFWTAAPQGWLILEGGTIGNIGSGATVRANADMINLYSLLWAVPAENLTILTNAGAPSTKGVSAAADFAAGKRIVLPNASGRTLIGRSAETEFTGLAKTGGSKVHNHKATGDHNSQTGSAVGDLRAAIGATNGDSARIGYRLTDPINPATGAGVGNAQYSVGGNGAGNTSFNHFTPVYGFVSTEPGLPPYLTVQYIIKY